MRLSAANLAGRGGALVAMSVLEVGMPFVRMLILTHLLSLRELGFATALAAAYGMLEQVTDVAAQRFVFSTPREDYQEALSCAHALLAVRGVLLCAAAVVLAPFLAAAMGVASDWLSFAALGGVSLVRSLENIAPRVAERDYKYGAQLSVNICGSALSLVAAVVVGIAMRDHRALLASLLGQAAAIVVASHVVADAPYRWRWASPYLARAYRFGYPLMFNGVGLAASQQGDRLLAGALLGLPALSLYNIVMLVALIPTTMVFRVMGTANLGVFHNAAPKPAEFAARVKFAAGLSPVVATVYALGLFAFGGVAIPWVFGARFRPDAEALALVSVVALVRIIRAEPFTSLMLHRGSTKSLALANLASLSGLALFPLLIGLLPGLTSAFVARGVGEFVALAVTLWLVAGVLGAAMRPLLLTSAAGAAVLLVAIGGSHFLNFGRPLANGIILFLLTAAPFVFVWWRFQQFGAPAIDASLEVVKGAGTK